VQYSDLSSQDKGESSADIRKRVNTARMIQVERYKGTGVFCNANLTPAMINRFCPLGDAERNLLKVAFEKLGLSARAWGRILKVSRTIADLENVENINVNHIAEAIQYRSLDRKFWG
jgi:magnesium chelatase family protein